MKNNLALFTLLFASLGLTSGGRTEAAENMSFRGTLIEPPSCTINNNHVIDVDFGEVLTSKIDGTLYAVTVIYTLECKNTNGKSLRINLLGKLSTFDNKALATSVTGLGIRLSADGQVLTPGTAGYRFVYAKLPVLKAVPVKDPTVTLAGGGFSAGATLEIEFL